jgi:hypothetical protein
MTRVVHYCRVSTVDQHPETPDGGTARGIADTLCDPLKQAMNEAWERVLCLGIEYGYRAAERGEPLPEAIERALRATDGRRSS